MADSVVLSLGSGHSGGAPGRFAQKPVPPGTVRAKNIFRTGRFLPGRFAHFSKK